MESQDGGAFAATPAPMAGLGNFKGVMLCNRPSDDPGMKVGGGEDLPPFKTAIATTHGEMLGLAPPRKTAQGAEVKTRGPSAALRRHVKWLKELQGQMKEEKEQVESEIQDKEQRKAKMKAVFSKHRDVVRRMMEERDAELLRGAASEKGAAKRSKPLWAMTEKEKEDFEEGEADDLISFAENLDFDKYIGDCEFRSGLGALKDRAGRVQKEQDAFKDALVRDIEEKACADDEERSTSAGSPRSKLEEGDGIDGVSIFGSDYSAAVGSKSRADERVQADGRPEWDTSTSCGDEQRAAVDATVKAAAERVLDSNPQLKQIHSKESMQKIVEKAARERLEHVPDLHEHMRRDPPPPCPLIVNSEDTQTRLHKPVECSQLPYLYRSPAV
mmetsp:Transcript_42592/g.97697  ORF Transcript_42592/g.97697 Transcript_42592/m.97697 type:complete len:386 (+) Transcript_42592:116-1273(+)